LDQSWKYSREYTPPAPVVTIELAGFSLELAVDTGFAGGILIPFPLFQSLALLSALTPDTYHAVMPDSRRVRLYTARVEVTLGSTKLLVDVHSSPLVEKKLIGRSFLRSFVAMLDGKKERLKLQDARL
jgi:clan AA aspartic protease